MEGRAQVAAYVRQQMLFVPRFLRGYLEHRPEIARAFADYYEAGKRDAALARKTKELVFLAISVAGASPACLIHLAPAITAEATAEEVAEAALIGMLASAFIPGGPGLPRAAEFMAKALELESHYRAGGQGGRDYLLAARFRT